jgi:hypothetical protein
MLVTANVSVRGEDSPWRRQGFFVFVHDAERNSELSCVLVVGSERGAVRQNRKQVLFN